MFTKTALSQLSGTTLHNDQNETKFPATPYLESGMLLHTIKGFPMREYALAVPRLLLSTTICLTFTDSIRSARAQQPAQQAPAQQPVQQAPTVAAPKAYTPVAVKPAEPVGDPSFDAFRKQLADIAKRKNRAALKKLVVAKGFFWDGESGDRLNKKLSSFDNFASAVALNDKDGLGWEILASAAAETTAEADEDRNGVICGPASPQINEQAFVALIKETGTDADEWGYPASEKLEVRGAPQTSAAVVETIGMNLIRVYPDEAATAASQDMLRIVLPSGKLGYVPSMSVLPIVTDQLCYIKEAGGWKIAGYAGGS